MREIDNDAILAAQDEKLLDHFIKEHEFFIIKCASSLTGRYIRKSDDEWSIALLAFSQAVCDYCFEKGSFLSFAQLVIKRRLVDYIRKEKKYCSEISVDPHAFSSELESEGNDTGVNLMVICKDSYDQDEMLKLEIEAVSKRLLEYGFSFYDLISCSPKSEKTKIACAKAIAYIVNNNIILSDMMQNKMLPIKIIQDNIKVPRKILERHRKYIIAGAEIISGDYFGLAEYMHFVKEELLK